MIKHWKIGIIIIIICIGIGSGIAYYSYKDRPEPKSSTDSKLFDLLKRMVRAEEHESYRK